MSGTRLFLSILALAGTSVAAVMEEADVVFMYAGDKAAHDKYGATWAAWGGGPQSGGVHSTGSFWCLTAGARLLHENEKLRDAVAKDIEGNPIKVPWQLDHVYEGTPTWFGCTNNPIFKKHLRKECLKAVNGKPDGIHIDDPSGVFAPVSYGGGCFCDHCMRIFRAYLKGNDSRKLREEAGVGSFDHFDYRDLVRKQAKTLEEYRKVQNSLPLRKQFVECQLRMAVRNIEDLGKIARRKLGRGMTLSVNTYYSGPGNHFMAFIPAITHMVAEVAHHAEAGTGLLADVVMAYRQAEAVERPLAATASGGDWAFIKERNAVDLVKVWIALSYACGQRLMVPHPKRQWCHTEEQGTHWYAAPVDEFAPLYRFVRANKKLFNGYRTVGPMAAPRGMPKRFDTVAQREVLKKALERGPREPITVGKKVWVFPRAKKNGGAVVHVVNLDYDAEAGRVRPALTVRVRVPAKLLNGEVREATFHAYDAEPITISFRREADSVVLEVPELRVWGVVELK